MWGDIAIAFLLAFIVTFMATPYTIKIAKKVGAVDVPKDKRRMHKKAMPKFGGPAVILGFLVSIIYLLIVMSMEHTINLFDQEQYGMKLLRNVFRNFSNIYCMYCRWYQNNKAYNKIDWTSYSSISSSCIWHKNWRHRFTIFKYNRTRRSIFNYINSSMDSRGYKCNQLNRWIRPDYHQEYLLYLRYHY